MKRREWQRVRLDSYCSKIGSGSTPRGGEQVYQSEGTALIRSQNVYNGLFTTDGLAFLGEEEATKLDGVTVEKGDVLLNITGDSVARCCQVPESVLPARVNQHVAIIRANPDEFDSRFLKYFFISPHMQSTMLSFAGSGGTRKALTKEMIQNFDVPKPALPIQEEIADVLSAYDELMENNRRRMELLEESARLLYREWFVRLRFPGHEHARLTNGVPQGWERKVLSDICADIRETVLPEELEPDTPYIGLEHMPRRSIALTEWGQSEAVTSSKNRFKTGDILFGKIRPYFHKVGIAFTDGVASSDAIVIRPNADELRSFVLMTVSSDKFVAEASQTMREGSKMPRADWKLMRKFPVALPPKGLLTTFTETTTAITDQLRNLCFQNQKLRAARDLLLPRLMSGELAV
jgi:type I restriction enzyme S subunit